jgi:hypothetical protein
LHAVSIFVTDEIPHLMDIATSKQKILFPISGKRQILRVEKNLNTIGVFTPMSKRPPELTKVVKTKVRLPDGQQVQARVEIIATKKSGLPITADQDKFFAFTKILEDIKAEHGTLRNPIRFNYGMLTRLLGLRKGGSVNRQIDEWLLRMTSVTIASQGMVWLAGRKRYSSNEAFHIFDKFVSIGEYLDTGEKAEQIHVYLSTWLLENFENNYVFPIDYEVYREMKLPIAKALVPLLQVWFFASRNSKRTTVEKRYPELAELLGIRPHTHLSKIREQMGNSLEELKLHNLIRSAEFQPTADDKNYKLVVTPGGRYLSERQAKLTLASGSPERRFFDDLLSDLVKRGVHQEVARDLLYNVNDLRIVRLQIAYGDSEVRRRSRTTKTNQKSSRLLLLVNRERRACSRLVRRSVQRSRSSPRDRRSRNDQERVPPLSRTGG